MSPTGLPPLDNGLDKAMPKSPSPQQKLEAWAAQGDFRAILENISQTPPGLLDLRTQVQHLNRAIAVASQKNSRGFLDQVFDQMVTFFAQVLIRLQLVSSMALERCGNSNSMRDLQLPREFLNDYLPQFQEILQLLAQLDQSRAAAARMWQLAQRKATPPVKTPAPSKLTQAASLNGNGRHRRLKGL